MARVTRIPKEDERVQSTTEAKTWLLRWISILERRLALELLTCWRIESHKKRMNDCENLKFKRTDRKCSEEYFYEDFGKEGNQWTNLLRRCLIPGFYLLLLIVEKKARLNQQRVDGVFHRPLSKERHLPAKSLISHKKRSNWINKQRRKKNSLTFHFWSHFRFAGAEAQDPHLLTGGQRFQLHQRTFRAI